MRRSAAPHDALVKDIRNYLGLRRVLCFRINQRPVRKRDGSYSAPGADPGAPDVVGVLPGGRFLWIEAKTGKARLSKAQEATAAAAERRGALVIVARCVADVHDALNEYNVPHNLTAMSHEMVRDFNRRSPTDATTPAAGALSPLGEPSGPQDAPKVVPDAP